MKKKLTISLILISTATFGVYDHMQLKKKYESIKLESNKYKFMFKLCRQLLKK